MNRSIPILLVLLISFTLSLVWCGDAECITGSGDNDCASLVCSLLGKHDRQEPNGATQDAAACSCVCHLPSIPLSAAMADNQFDGQRSSLPASPLTLEAPTRTPFRPPLAA